MTENMEGVVGPAGEVQAVRVSPDEYRARLGRILGTIKLDEGTLDERLIVEYRADGTATVWIRAQAGGNVSVQFEVPAPVDLVAILSSVHDGAYEEARERLKLATAEHVMAELASGGGL